MPSPTANPPRLFAPKEGGAWGALCETLLAGWLAAWSPHAGLIALAIVALFFLRQPVRLLLAKLVRGRSLPTPGLVVGLVVAWGLLAAASVALPARAQPELLAGFLPVIVLGGWQLLLDVRGHGRELAAEIIGSVGMTGCVLALTFTGERAWEPGVELWLLLVARHVVAVLFIRAWLRRSRGQEASLAPALAALGVAFAAAVWAAFEGHMGWLAAGAPLLIALRLALAMPFLSRPVVPKRLGVTELVFGIVYAAVAGLGVG